MPQFNFTNYSSQIFWFLICFSALYVAMHFIILPRIYNIINNRKKAINSDILSTKTINSKLEEIKKKSEDLRSKAANNYDSCIEEVARTHLKEREKAFEDLKKSTDEMINKSRNEIKSLTEKSQIEATKIIQDLFKTIKAKILN